MMTTKILRIVLDIISIMLVSSVVMDTLLWFKYGYLVPSWTIAGISLMVIVLLQVMKILVR